MEGEQADFQSLTPSQIKSMEKGEKPLPSYLRQVNPLVTELLAVTLRPTVQISGVRYMRIHE